MPLFPRILLRPFDAEKWLKMFATLFFHFSEHPRFRRGLTLFMRRDDPDASEDSSDELADNLHALHRLQTDLRLLQYHFPDLYADHGPDMMLDLAIRKHNHRLRLPPPAPFDLRQVADHHSTFRFSYYAIMAIATALLPSAIVTSCRCQCDGSVALAVLLYRHTWPTRWVTASSFFGRSPAWLSGVYHWVLDHLHVIASAILLDPIVPYISESGLYDIDAAVTYFRKEWGFDVYGMVDGTTFRIARPTVGESEVYSYYKHCHALNSLFLNTMDGIVAHVCGPFPGRYSDAACAIAAEFECTLSGLRTLIEAAGISSPCIIGDSGFALSDSIITPWSKRNFRILTAREKMFNFLLSRERIGAEWAVLTVKSTWRGLAMPIQHQLGRTKPDKAQLLSVLLANIHVCTYGRQHESYYNCYAPSLEDYLQFLSNYCRHRRVPTTTDACE